MVLIHTSQMQIDARRNANANHKGASKSHMFYTPNPIHISQNSAFKGASLL